MQRPVPIVVWRAYIVLPFDDLNIRLALHHFRHPVHIVNVAAYHSDAGNVVDALPRRLNRRRKTLLS